MKTITLRVSDAEHKILAEYAELTERTQNDILREFVRSLAKTEPQRTEAELVPSVLAAPIYAEIETPSPEAKQAVLGIIQAAKAVQKSCDSFDQKGLRRFAEVDSGEQIQEGAVLWITEP